MIMSKLSKRTNSEDALIYNFYINNNITTFESFAREFHLQFSKYRCECIDTYVPYFIKLVAEDHLYLRLRETGESYQFNKDDIKFCIKRRD